MTRRLLVALGAAVLMASLSASAALAGEITGNGKKLLHVEGGGKWGTGLHARSLCAYSGQEDLQFFFDEGQQNRKPVATKGDPGHAQSWGQIPKFVRDELTLAGESPGVACNPTSFGSVQE